MASHRECVWHRVVRTVLISLAWTVVRQYEHELMMHFRSAGVGDGGSAADTGAAAGGGQVAPPAVQSAVVEAPHIAGADDCGGGDGVDMQTDA